LLDALLGLGYRVPKDVEVATMDDNELGQAVDVPLITASQRGHDMGVHSVDILLGRIANADLPAQQRFLKAELNFKQEAPVEIGETAG